MGAFLIFDAVILLLLVLFAVRGAYKGFVLSLCGLLAVIIAFVGAGFVSRTLAPMVADALEPRFAVAIEEKLEESIAEGGNQSAPPAESGEGETDYPLQDVLNALRDMGLYEKLIDTIDEAVEQGMTHVAATAAAKVAAAVARTVAYLIIFLAAFVLILIVWKLISRALDLVARLPVLHFLNKTLGAVFGLLKCCILLFIIAWILQFFGNIIPEETVEKTYLLEFFMTTNPVALISSLL